MKLNLLMCFRFLFFEKPLKGAPFYSPILRTLWSTYLQIRIKESCMELSRQLIFKIAFKILKL